MIIVVNKWDTIEKDKLRHEAVGDDIRDHAIPSTITLTKQRLHKLLEMIKQTRKSREAAHEKRTKTRCA